MPETVQDLVTRVSVLEADAKQYADRLLRLENAFDTSNTAMRKELVDLEHAVDDLRVDTALIKRMVTDVQEIRGDLRKIADTQQDQNVQWAKLKGWVAGAMAVGGVLMVALEVFREPLTRLVLHLLG